jgi:ligand-binding sensor domain-containing protein/signal transduction histidine kinase/DNA-binding response OmpR family regulator
MEEIYTRHLKALNYSLIIKLFGILVFISLQVEATDKEPFEYLNIENGLSNNSVTTIFQDHYGFMWFGTYDGLNRYDGYNFKVFKNQWGNERSLINNHIICIAEDRENRVWVGTEKGIVYYNYSDSKIYPVYYQPQQKKHQQKIVSRINSIVTDANGDLYIASEENGLLICKHGSNVCKQVVGLNNTTAYNIQKLLTDKQGRVWVFINNVGLCQYNKRLDRMVTINHELPGVNCLTIDAVGNFIWVGSESGLYKYNITKNKMVNLNTAGFKLTNKNIMSLYLDKQGKLWIATDGGGVNIIDQASGKTDYMLPGEQKGSLSSGSVYDIYEDRDSRKWIATLRGGLNIIDYKNHQFKSIAHDPQNKNSLVNNFTRAFCEDAEKNIWIGTSGGGLSFWNTKLNTYTNYAHNDADPNSLSSNLVTGILCDYKNNIWITTFNGGLNLFNKLNHKFKHYVCYNTYNNTEDHNTWRLFQDSKHNLWVSATRGGALYLYNSTKDKFEMFDHRLMSINCFWEDRAGTIWAGTNSELVRIDVKNKHHKITLINSAIQAIKEDTRGNFWVGTDGGGLLLFDRKSGKYKRYTEADGLTDNAVINILEDNSGYLWLSTYHGISKLNPRLKTFKNYYASDGLQSNQFNYNAALKLHSGEFLFGGIKGFNRFNPDSVKPHVSTPNVFLTGFRVNNVPIEQDSTYNGKGAINLQSITIPYDKAVISIDFVAVEYSFPDKISYAYYLEGWDHVWNNSGKIKVANYSRLNEGSYTLRIKATNSDGVWSNHERVIYITVLPPWYRTWWAWFIYVSITIAFIYYYLLYRSKQTKLKHEVEIAYIRADKEKELNEKKLSFFTNISHEFRTPLTLIINPVKDMLNSSKNTAVDSDLNIVYRNARRLLSLVDQLLLFRKTESENDSLKIVNLNFSHLCYEVYLCFTHQAKIRNITYLFDCVNDDIELYGDREKIEIALFNLISNALKFTPDNGTVTCKIKEVADQIYIAITDTGCGIPGDVGDRLFEKFYKAQNKTAVKTGFGIGLYLVKNFVDSHNGQISYQSTVNGTTFLITLNKGKAHFGNNLIFEDITNGSIYLEELIEELPVKLTQDEGEAILLDMMISDQQSMLIIDDNTEIREYIKRIFKTHYKLYEADNCDEGFEMIKELLPDVVISDIVMPGINGIELCKLVKDNSALNHIPVLLLTAELTPDIKLQATEAGAYDCMSKPFEKELLIARVSAILKNRSNLQTYFYNEITLKSNNLKISEEYKDFLNRCIAVIENHLHNPDFNIKILAAKVGMSHSNLYKKVKLISGQSVNSFIRYIRIRKSAELFINTNCNVNEAAYRVGLNDIKYFREQFHKLFGMNPSEFIKKHRVAFHKHYLLDNHINQVKDS